MLYWTNWHDHILYYKCAHTERERSSYNLRHYCGLFAFAHALCISSLSRSVSNTLHMRSISQLLSFAALSLSLSLSLCSNYFLFHHFIYRANLKTWLLVLDLVVVDVAAVIITMKTSVCVFSNKNWAKDKWKLKQICSSVLAALQANIRVFFRFSAKLSVQITRQNSTINLPSHYGRFIHNGVKSIVITSPFFLYEQSMIPTKKREQFCSDCLLDSHEECVSHESLAANRRRIYVFCWKM